MAASSGQSAQFMAIAALASVGDNIVATSNLYGGTYNQLKVFLPRLGITTKFVRGEKPEDFKTLIDEKTKAVYLESIGNPRYSVPDFEAIVKIAHDAGVPVLVSILQVRSHDTKFNIDNRLTTPSAQVGIFAAPSTTVQTSSSTPQRNGSAATEPRSEV